LGYAYAAKPFSDRAAYAWDVDLSIYLDRCCQHIGIGSCLYEKLEAILKDLGYHNLYALITSENDISKQFHRKHGFTPVGVMKNSGMKFDRWISVEWYEKSICEPIIPIQPPIPISDYPIIPTFFPDLP
jgi:phosphinothricin acetyltransferase